MKKTQIYNWLSGMSFGLAAVALSQRKWRKWGAPFLMGISAGLGSASRMDQRSKPRS